MELSNVQLTVGAVTARVENKRSVFAPMFCEAHNARSCFIFIFIRNNGSAENKTKVLHTPALT